MATGFGDSVGATLEDQFEARIERVRDALRGLEPVEARTRAFRRRCGHFPRGAIENRTIRLIDDATGEVVLVVGESDLITDELVAKLNDLPETVVVIIGAMDDDTKALLKAGVPYANKFVSGLEWLHEQDDTREDSAIGRLLLVDRETLLVSSYEPTTGTERAVFGSGFGNGPIMIPRLLIGTGLLPSVDARPE